MDFRSLVQLVVALLLIIVTACQQPSIQPGTYGWFDFQVEDFDTSASPVSLAKLNEDMAGQDGYIRVVDGHFYDGNGKQIRLLGTNFTFASCFPGKDTATVLAAHMARLGMNVARFHHMDNRSAPGGIWSADMQTLDAEQLDRLDWFVYQLKKQGIYTNINLHVSYHYPGLDYEAHQFNYGKAIDNFFRPYIQQQKRFAEDLLTHMNPDTGTSYLEEPAISFIEINNENSLLSNWQLLDQLYDPHAAALKDQWRRWLSNQHDHQGTTDLFSIIANYDQMPLLTRQLMWRFLMDTEMEYNREMATYIRDTLGTRALVANTQASYSGVAGVLRESTYSDFIDMHAYWQHPRFPGQRWSRSDWVIDNSSMVSDPEAGTLSRFAQHKVAGLPLTISEYDHPAPNDFVAEMYPMLASVAAYQDWDGIYHFNFSGPWNMGRMTGFFSSAGHPLKKLFLPVAALIFRQHAIPMARDSMLLYLPQKSVPSFLAESGDMIRLHGSNMADVWSKVGWKPGLVVEERTELSFTSNDALQVEGRTAITSSNGWGHNEGPLWWDTSDSSTAVFELRAQAAQGCIGYVGGRTVQLPDVEITFASTPNQWAAITLTSLDAKPLAEAASILLVAAGRVENVGMNWNENRTTVGEGWGDPPVRAESVPASLILHDLGSWKVEALDANGHIDHDVETYYRNGRCIFAIGAEHKTLWYLLTRK